MKKLLICFSFLFLASALKAQISNPIVWSYSAVKVADKTYEIHISAALEEKWHIYSQQAGEGPEPTSFVFTINPLVQLVGKVKELGKLEESFDPNFNSTLRFYSEKVDFVQKVKLKNNTSTVLKGTLTYMVCNDRKCLPPRDISFSVKISGK